MLEDTLQCRDVVLVFGVFKRVLQHRADVLGFDLLHLPVRIKTLALFLTLAQRDNIVMARIAMQARNQLLYLGGRPLDPLEEDAATETNTPVMPRARLLRWADSTMRPTSTLSTPSAARLQ